LYEETLEPRTPAARVIGRFADGRPAAVRAAFGKGEAIALGSYLSTAYNAKPTPQARKFFEGLLDWAGVQRPVEVSGAEVEVRMLESGDSLIVFVFNHSGQPVTPAIHVAGQRLEPSLAPQGVWLTHLARRGRD
jgi:hypothetical protein